MPTSPFMPAEYPRLPAIDIGRKVTAPDISKHFIDFMKNDNIGLLANQLLVMSDRVDKGMKDDTCITISELMSTALDYPKTGIVVCGYVPAHDLMLTLMIGRHKEGSAL